MRRLTGTVFTGMVLALSASASAKVVISEFRCRGPAGGNDEFVEIYNAGTDPVDVSGWKLLGSNSSGGTSVRATIPAGTTMPPWTFLLFVNATTGGYSGTVPGDVTYTIGIGDNGGIALADAGGNLMDQVGLSSGSAYKEGATLTPFSSVNKDQSYERRSIYCGPDQDTDANAADFEYRDGFSNPQNSHSCRLECAGSPCIVQPEPVCHDEQTLHTFGEGTCQSGFCDYPLTPETCAFGCAPLPAPAHCLPDPCLGVTCDTPPNDQCFEASGTCSGGTCTYTPLPAETPCDDGNLCSDGDACNDQGDCQGGSLRTCPLPDPECQNGDTVSRTYLDAACVPATGLCEYTWQDTTCSFGCDPDTGYCLNDPCAGVVCDTPPSSQCYRATGTCIAGTCQYDPLPATDPCDDQDPCTDQDRCDGAGSCAGTPRVCDTPPNSQCFDPAGTCSEGICLYTRHDTGSPCDDGDLCSLQDACGDDGTCRGIPRVCEVPAPYCLDMTTTRVALQAACDPADGSCVVTTRDLGCGPAGCQEATGLCAPHPLISMFRTRGPQGGNDEFLEIYNPSTEAVDIGSWTIGASNQSGLMGVRFTFPAGTVMGPGTFLLLANPSTNGYSETTPPDFTYSTGITDTGGVALIRGDGTVIDAVGMDPGSAYREGTPLAPTTQNLRQAYQRKTLRCGPDQDFDDNATDFALVTDFQPRNARSCRLECAGLPCVSRPTDRCQDPTTRVFYDAGTCQDGSCTYPEHQETCPFGCQEGLCLPDPCEGVVCDTPPNPYCFEATGSCVEGTCTYTPLAASTPCDDGNLCTTGDQCTGTGACAGIAVECPDRGPECLSPTVSRSHAAGECSRTTGECSYPYVDTDCPFGCNGATGLCLGDPCLEVTCDQPPSACHRSPGICSQGACSYPLREVGSPCDDGDPCTLEDSCGEEGVCLGTPMVCNSPGIPCRQPSGTCVEGECQYLPETAGTPCDDGDPCTRDDQCLEDGTCGGTPVPGCGEDLGGTDLGGTDPGGTTDVPGPSDLGGGEDPGPGEDATPRPDVLEDSSSPVDSGRDVPSVHDAPEDQMVRLDTMPGGEDTTSQKKGGGCAAGASSAVPGWALALALAAFLGRRLRRRSPAIDR
ncbi:MAG TPA: lamin tail domain-containing protein [Myxococcota bacterium]|nr:lamin tail domain-containing protein [Myxococcota bacterium]HQK50865.1 lamin tail domain-containing protein [Myxococcota bacterium]